MTSSSSFVPPDHFCQRFTLSEIQLATQNFDENLVIGHGGFGKVYKCNLKIESVITEVAIKRLDSKSDQGATEFEAEVKLLSKLRHGNLVLLFGFCNEGKEMVIVYEFVPNGTIRDHLCRAECALSWLQRLNICIGAARALDYLHTGTATQQGIIHRDVKTSNILLDANFAAKIADFGLAKTGPINQTQTNVSTGVKGTFGYLDPCYFYSGKLTRKSDVYAFGVVLFEVLSGKQAVDSTLDEDQWSLAAWVQDQIKDGKLDKIIDSRLIGQISKKWLKEFAAIAGQCLHAQPKQRPTMAEVVVRLESILSHERELANFVIDERKFVNKLRYFFTGKADLMRPDSRVGRKSVVNAHYAEKNQKINNGSLRIFTFAELESATNNFNDSKISATLNEIIYKGWVDEKTYTPTECGVGLAIYVRKKPVKAFKMDLKLEDFNHPNLVKLFGYCLHKDELYWAQELIPDARLDKLLSGELGTPSLSLVARLKIAVGAAQGLSFLHQRNFPAYMNFKTSFILVDKDFNARLSDFEVENSFVVSDSHKFFLDVSYAAPELYDYTTDRMEGIKLPLQKYGFGVKSEIYSFGLALLEILTGIKPVGFQTEEVISRKIMKQVEHNNYPLEGAFKLSGLVSNCLQPNQEKRPSIEEIVQVLSECYQDEIKSI